MARDVLSPWAAQLPVAPHLCAADEEPPGVEEADVVLRVDVLHHIPRPRQEGFLRRLIARMPPGTRLILKDIDAARPVLTMVNRLHDLLLTGQPGEERRHDDMARFLTNAGLVQQLSC